MQALEKLFREWQRVLRLSDWNLRMAVRPAMEMGSDHGRVRVYELKKCAFVSLLDPNEADPSEVEPYDPEVALVHEQLHCLLHAFAGDRDTVEDLCQEQAIHILSTLLVEQKREIRNLEAKLKRQRAVSSKVLEMPVAA
jgi:hypothetical protein